MKAYRELDALVAEKAMGWVSIPHPEPENLFPGVKPGRSWFPPNNDYTYWRDKLGPGYANGVAFPYYSTSIADAWEVFQKLDTYSLTKAITVNEDDGPLVEVFTAHVTLFEPERFAFEKSFVSAPHAICLAALKAVGCELQ